MIKDNCPESATITGVQKIVAEIGMATASATTCHLIFAESTEINLGESSNMPAVAKTDNAKPGSIAWNGSSKIKVAIAAPNAGKPNERSPRYFAINKTEVMTAARNTDGVGLTNKIKKSKTIPVTHNLV